ARRRLLQRQLEIAAEIGALLGSVAAAPAAATAEDQVEQVERAAAETLAPLVAEAGVPELVVKSLFLRVGEDLVGLVELLELFFGVLVAGIGVRVNSARFAAVGGFDFARRSGPADAQDFVEVAL